MKITLTGCGYLGIVVAACFAARGHRVLCHDKNPERLSLDNLPYEPGLADLISAHGKNISFTDCFDDIPAWGNTHYICVSSPPRPDGLIDTSHIFNVIDKFRRLSHFNLFVKSTVPVGTTREIIERLRATENTDFQVIFEPEFTSEGNTVSEFLHGTYRVFGSDDRDNIKPIVAEIYASFDSARHLFMSAESAELSKLSTNAMLACRLSFINELANYTQSCGADINDVCDALGSDQRIGKQYLKPGGGYGGICLPKDTDSLLYQMREAGGAQMLAAISAVNQSQFEKPAEILRRHFGKCDDIIIAVWGLAFKAHTDDTRHSPGVSVTKRLCELGFTVRAYDPKATLPTPPTKAIPNCEQSTDMFKAAEGADAIVICAEWPQFIQADLSRLAQTMRQKIILDCKHALDATAVRRAGFTYLSIGRRD